MKRIAPALVTLGLAAAWTGCQSATDSSSSAPAVKEDAQQVAAVDYSGYPLVKLKVPNMT